ncbi:MAG: hypothetical protein IPM82_12075 [Saprospiraceae bacterium]|nr:hypothetical protein [Saprospiraceae bacterium]
MGPEGYQVWTDSAISWDSANIEAIRRGILSRIDQRQSDYLELMRMISSGERDYLEFRPILQELLPLADVDVRQAIQAELDAAENLSLAESIIVGVASIGLLLLTIFPPTSALGVAGLVALEVGLQEHMPSPEVPKAWNKKDVPAVRPKEHKEFILKIQIESSSSMIFSVL